jgi:hypothetical protein
LRFCGQKGNLPNGVMTGISLERHLFVTARL